MIGDSWQLRKHSLLGHWAVHSVEPPGPWRTGENGKRRRRKVGVGEQEPEQKRRGARQEPTGEKVLHVLADGGREAYTDGGTERGMEV